MKRLFEAINLAAAKRTGFVVARTARLHPWQFADPQIGPLDEHSVTDEDRRLLRPDHPKLIELKRRYVACDPTVTSACVWTDGHLSPADLLYFRGDNAFVWQVRGTRTPLSYGLCYYALKADDDEGLLERLDEDARFGVHHVEIDGRPVTRDLIDSVGEIRFLLRHGLIGSGTRVLDIGAGYGRLAWRIEQAVDGAEVFATDADPRSTFLCGHYLRTRGARRAHVLPLDEVDALLTTTCIDVAINVHSFSECREQAVEWWVEQLARHHVRWLMVVPNDSRSGAVECQLNDGRSIEPIFKRFGYRPVVREPRFKDSFVQQHAVDPAYLHLFELNDVR